MVNRAIGVRAKSDRAELWIRYDKVFGEQSAGAEQPAVDDLPRGLDSSNIRRIQKPGHCDEIAIRNIGPEGSMPAQGLGTSDISAHDSDACPKIEATKHSVEQRCIASSPRYFERLKQ